MNLVSGIMVMGWMQVVVVVLLQRGTAVMIAASARFHPQNIDTPRLLRFDLVDSLLPLLWTIKINSNMS